MLKTEKPALAAAISVVISVINKSAKVPIMQNICIERDGDELVLRGGNGDMEITSRLNVMFDDAFEDITLPAHLLDDAVRRMPDGAELRLDRADSASQKLEHINIRAGRARVKLPVLPASDFPRLDAGALPHRLSLTAPHLAKAIKAVLPAVCDDQSRYYLAGVLLQPSGDGMRVVATDGRRLSVRFLAAAEFDQADTLGKVPSVIVPTKVVERAIKVMDGQDDVTLDMSDQKIRVTAGRTVMTGKLVEGTYPDVARILPSPDAQRITFSSAALQAAIARVLVVTPDAGNGVAFRAAEGTMRINARDTAVGDADDEIACDPAAVVEGGFHGTQMREALEHIDGDQVEYLVGPGAAPTMVHTPGDDRNYTIMMPMQVKHTRTQA